MAFHEHGIRIILSTRETEHKVTWAMIRTGLEDQIRRLERMKFFVPEDGRDKFENDMRKLYDDIIKGYSELE